MTAAAADALLMELFSQPQAREDPYPVYRQLREAAPVHRSSFGPVVLSRYHDCVQALRDHRLGKGEATSGLVPGGDSSAGDVDAELRDAFFERAGNTMLFVNPPDHTRLRRLVSRAFTPGRVEALKPQVARMVSDILDRMADEGETDAMAALAFPLPVAVIGDLVGVPAEDRAAFQPLVRDAVRALDFSADPDAVRQAFVAQDRMGEYMSGLIAERRKHPTDDLLSGLIDARDRGDALTEDEMVATAILLFAAGFETTTNLIGNGLLALLQHPVELRRLRDLPILLGTAVEELLRWDAPVQLDARTVLEPAEIAGEALEPGDFVITLLGAANRDPQRFADPELFDVGRSDNTPLSFASGIHYCLGAGLARMEAATVFGQLLARFGEIRLADRPERRDNLTLRGLATLPVEVRA